MLDAINDRTKKMLLFVDSLMLIRHLGGKKIPRENITINAPHESVITSKLEQDFTVYIAFFSSFEVGAVFVLQIPHSVVREFLD